MSFLTTQTLLRELSSVQYSGSPVSIAAAFNSMMIRSPLLKLWSAFTVKGVLEPLNDREIEAIYVNLLYRVLSRPNQRELFEKTYAKADNVAYEAAYAHWYAYVMLQPCIERAKRALYHPLKTRSCGVMTEFIALVKKDKAAWEQVRNFREGPSTDGILRDNAVFKALEEIRQHEYGQFASYMSDAVRGRGTEPELTDAEVEEMLTLLGALTLEYAAVILCLSRRFSPRWEELLRKAVTAGLGHVKRLRKRHAVDLEPWLPQEKPAKRRRMLTEAIMKEYVAASLAQDFD